MSIKNSKFYKYKTIFDLCKHMQTVPTEVVRRPGWILFIYCNFGWVEDGSLLGWLLHLYKINFWLTYSNELKNDYTLKLSWYGWTGSLVPLWESRSCEEEKEQNSVMSIINLCVRINNDSAPTLQNDVELNCHDGNWFGYLALMTYRFHGWRHAIGPSCWNQRMLAEFNSREWWEIVVYS